MKIKQNSLALKKIDSAGKIIYRSGQWIILVLCFLIFIYLTFQSLLYTTSIYNAPDDPSTVIMMHDNFYINAAVISIAFICGILFLQRLMDKINPRFSRRASRLYIFIRTYLESSHQNVSCSRFIQYSFRISAICH